VCSQHVKMGKLKSFFFCLKANLHVGTEIKTSPVHDFFYVSFLNNRKVRSVGNVSHFEMVFRYSTAHSGSGTKLKKLNFLNYLKGIKND
jgi:hypothetical protein